MLSEPFSDWWCCLNPRERNMLSALIGSWFANNEYVLQTTFTIYSFAFGMAALTLVSAYFIAHYGLTEGFVLDEEGEPIQVLFFDTTLWPALYAFSLTDDFICSEPCELLTFWS